MKIRLFRFVFVKTSVMGGGLLALAICLGCLCHKATLPSEDIIYRDSAIEMLDIVFEAISRYSWDVGTLPNENSLLDDLLKDSGISGWEGPYISTPIEPIIKLLSEKCIIEKSNERTIKIILAGFDGEFETQDDIVGEYNLTRGKDFAHESLWIKGDGAGRDYIKCYD